MMKRSSLKDRVLENAKKSIKEYRKTGSFWEDSIEFNSDYRLDEKCCLIADRLFDSLKLKPLKKEEQKRKDFEILTANLIRQKRKPVSVSLNRNKWILSQYNQVSYSIIDLIKIMTKKGFISMKIGYQNLENKTSRLTRIFATEKLFELFPETFKGVKFEPFQLIELHDGNGKLIEYKETQKTYSIRKKLKIINEVNSNAKICFDGYRLNPALKAIYIDDFSLYGRLHTSGTSHYQGISGEEREEITIDGDTVIELDYCGLHPNLLYASMGIQLQQDPYTIIDERPELRPFLKNILLYMLNSVDRITAERAANFWLYKNDSERIRLAEINVTKASPFIDKFIESHSKISMYFFDGKKTGLKVMNKDSKIALDVTYSFAKRGIPVLPIHDSFIVQAQYESELRQVMINAYRKHTRGFDIQIK